jgi:hypothetical protein
MLIESTVNKEKGKSGSLILPEESIIKEEEEDSEAYE